jgi:hypothetical protein
MNEQIMKIYRNYERGKARRRKLSRIAYRLDNKFKPMKAKLIILIALAFLLVGCARELCPAYTHSGGYYYQSGVIKKK